MSTNFIPDPTPAKPSELNSRFPSLRVVNEDDGDTTSRATRAAAVQAAINDALSEGYPTVYVPSAFQNYDASAVTFQDAVKMVVEGGNPATFDVRAYGAAVDGSTDDLDAVDAAISAANAAGTGSADGSGQTVAVPAGVCGVSDEITVPSRVSITGPPGGKSAVLQALSGFLGTQLIRLGEGLGLVFGCRVENLTLDCNAQANIGIYSTETNEHAGANHVTIKNYLTKGIFLDTTSQGQAYWNDLHILADSSASAARGVHVKDGGAGMNRFHNVTITHQSLTTQTNPALEVEGSTRIEAQGIHIESYQTGILLGAGVGGSLKDVTGGTGLTSVVKLSTASSVIVQNVNRNGATNAIEDTEEGITLTDNVVQLYATYHGTPRWVIGTATGLRNRGTADITTGNTSVAVSHGLAATPSLENIQVTKHTSFGSASEFWITNSTSTQFTINVDVDPGGTVTFGWHAEV